MNDYKESEHSPGNLLQSFPSIAKFLTFRIIAFQCTTTLLYSLPHSTFHCHWTYPSIHRMYNAGSGIYYKMQLKINKNKVHLFVIYWRDAPNCLCFLQELLLFSNSLLCHSTHSAGIMSVWLERQSVLSPS